MSKVSSYKDFEPKHSHTYLLDNSVLLYCFAPIGSYNSKLQSSIGKFLQRCSSVECGLSTTSLVISEFQNKVLKDFFEEFKKTFPVEKRSLIKLKADYRGTSQFKDDIAALSSATKNILKLCDRYPDDFQDIDIDSILTNTNLVDYNDAYFIELANRKGWQIVTRDRDILENPKRQTDVISFLD